jgi:hypothetical protein
MAQEWNGPGSIEVELIGHDGNAFNILGKVAKEMRRAGASEEEVKQYHADATAGDYDHLLAVTDAWVDVI